MLNYSSLDSDNLHVWLILAGFSFCLGDAVHLHPPTNGLGFNTSVQDAYNLAWKLPYALNCTPSPALLDLYNIEWQPVGQQVVTRANNSWRIDLQFFMATRMADTEIEKRREIVAALVDDSRRGRDVRRRFDDAIDMTRYQFASLECEINHFYEGAEATVYIDDEDETIQAKRASVYQGQEHELTTEESLSPG